MSKSLYRLMHDAKQIKTGDFITHIFHLVDHKDLNMTHVLIDDRIVFSNKIVKLTYGELNSAVLMENKETWLVTKANCSEQVKIELFN